MQNKQRNEERQYEVIVAPTDVLEKELDEVLGGVNAECPLDGCSFNCNCYNGGHTGSTGKEKQCTQGFIWDDDMQNCIPIME